MIELSILETVIFEQKELFDSEKNHVLRKIEHKDYVETEQVVVISGVRGSPAKACVYA